VQKSNPGHIGGREVLSPLGQPCHLHGGWNCWTQTQVARTPKSLPYLQPSHDPCQPCQEDLLAGTASSNGGSWLKPQSPGNPTQHRKSQHSTSKADSLEIWVMQMLLLEYEPEQPIECRMDCTVEDNCCQIRDCFQISVVNTINENWPDRFFHGEEPVGIWRH